MPSGTCSPVMSPTGSYREPSRASRHVAAARWIESKAPERVEDLADVLAYHYAAALELARATGESEQAADLVVPTLRFLTLAGERALGLDTARRFRISSGRSRSRHQGTPTVPRRWSASAKRRSRRGAPPTRRRLWRRRPLPSELAAIPPPPRWRCLRTPYHLRLWEIRVDGRWLWRPSRSSSPCRPARIWSWHSPTFQPVKRSEGGRRRGTDTPSELSRLPRSSGCPVPHAPSISGASPAERSVTPEG